MQPVSQAIFVLFCLLLPFSVYGFAIHWLERWIQTHLSRWIGWRAVLVTGWLGTPIHELSHAAACLLFGHKIEEMRLFDPDIKAGRLGYIRHTYRQGAWWGEIGHGFIGTAPLIGGSLVLVLLMVWFYPTVTWQLVQALREANWNALDEGLKLAIMETGRAVWNMLQQSNWFSWKPWLFLYFALCVGSHSAPSRSDYTGALKGGLLLLGIVLPIMSVAMIFVPEPLGLVKWILAQCAPLWTMLVLVLVLTGSIGLGIALVSLAVGRVMRGGGGDGGTEGN